jgi:hypothetical protein
MSENTLPAVPQFDADDFMSRLRAYEARAAELYPANKANLLAALAAAGITRVTVSFDGYGDSGQIENLEAKAGEALVGLPDTVVEIASTEYFAEEIHRRAQPLPEAIESLCYLILEAKHGGWENNEGAYGEFLFDVAQGSITLDFNYRIEATDNHTHQF